MLITLLSLAALIVGIVLTARFVCYEWLGFILTVIGGISSLLCVILIIGCLATTPINYANVEYRHNMLVQRLELQSENVVGNELLYSEIVAFNSELRATKY